MSMRLIFGLILLTACTAPAVVVPPNLSQNDVVITPPVEMNSTNNSAPVTVVPNETVNRTLPKNDTRLKTLRTAVTPYEYVPSEFYVKAGRPIQLIINGDNITSCTEDIISSSLGIRQRLHTGENIINITPLRPGTYTFSCAMGMVGGTINVYE